MGVCDKRHFLLTICVLQIIVTTERQVFDFLGYMWVPILVNLFNIIFVILGFFGAFQYRPKYIISYCVWNVIWLSWNVFLICFYLNVGGLDKDSDLLNLGTGSFSWWLINGPGCHEHPNKTVPDQPDVFRPIRPENVTGCFLDYEVIEVIHSSVQCFLAVMAIIGGICLSRVFLEEDDSSQIRKKKKKQPRPLYSIEYSRPEPSSLHHHAHHQSQHHLHHQQHQQQHQQQYQSQQDDNNVSPKPMTPRRVKRRSVISRDGTHRRSSQRLRSSTASRQSARRKNPVNRIMDQQESLYANAPALTSHNVNSMSHGNLNYDRISGHWDRERNASHPNIPSWQLDALNTLSASSPNIWGHDAANVAAAVAAAAAATFSAAQPSLSPANWETASSTRNLTESWQGAGAASTGNMVNPSGEPVLPPVNPMQWQGQSNPSFQQTSTQSLNGEDLDELYGNRPASARSSYSNYHGVRATPQVPSRSDIVRQSQRQFVLSGPPAYQDTVI